MRRLDLKKRFTKRLFDVTAKVMLPIRNFCALRLYSARKLEHSSLGA